MPLAIAWWGWVIVVLLSLVVLTLLVGWNARRKVLREFIAYLNEHATEFEVLQVQPSALVLRNKSNGSEGPLSLERLFDAVTRVEPYGPKTRREVYAHWVKDLREGEGGEITLEKDGQRVFPRLITDEFFAQAPNGREAPHKPLGETGLFIAYVLDNESSVMYLGKHHLDDLKMDLDALHELALTNLRRITPSDMLRNIVSKDGTLNMIKTMDTYDAARVLLLPEALHDGRQLAVAVPDRDSLVVMPIPNEPDWDKLRKLPVIPGGDRLLLNRPLVVSKDGIRLM